ncbi:hypothetical protein ASPFODRAFT_317813 [Aspergillus luchuensis CBS 106.47]|uniref:Uncharacterized protein n=1 Tax=Aspergillus luchuensis (strain CBS 106.47) TaxID=1137211 RepID=A0A1M3T9I8_ASPLC|nr:hypothetical protein ASPFODRAFT_317813 [Aspergillus luchuensis CBS 106.47]
MMFLASGPPLFVVWSVPHPRCWYRDPGNWAVDGHHPWVLLGVWGFPVPRDHFVEVAWYRSCLGNRQMMRRVARYPRLGGAEKQTKILRSSSDKSGALLPRSYAPHLEGLVLGSTVAWRGYSTLSCSSCFFRRRLLFVLLEPGPRLRRCGNLDSRI